ncbi:MAG: nucleotidyltransferase family protein [Deltaproteobacteria bacterium]|nr:nucleotidyltransferase family protein [Deltaproteobacteria bacterium]
MSSVKPQIAGIILAAGSSKRMGSVKSLLPWGDGLLLERVIKNASRSDLSSLTVVLGYKAEIILEKISFQTSTVIINPDYRRGHSSSLQAGLNVVPADTDGALFLLGDQPFVTIETINRLIRASGGRSSSLVIPTFCGKRGNPVLVHRSIFPMLQKITGDTGPRVFFDRLREQIKEVDVPDSGIHIDIDTMEEYQRLVRLIK